MQEAQNQEARAIRNNSFDILLIEDEDPHAELIQRAFEDRGGHVHVYRANSLSEARSYLASNIPTLIIADWRLPDGESLALLPDRNNPLATPVILMTSYGNERIAVEALKSGALDYVVKSPESMMDMAHLAERAIEQWNVRAERIRMQQALKESESQFRLLAENASDMISRHTTEGIFIYVSPACKAMIGFSPEELIGRSSLDFVHPEDQPNIKNLFSKNPSIPTGYTFAYRARHKNGQYIWLEISTRFIMDEKTDSVIEIQAASRDITERVQAEEALRESNELHSLFMKHSPIYAFIKQVTPTESRVLMASENYQDMIGIPGSEMIGKTMEQLFPAEFAAKITADDWAVVSSGKALKLDEDLNGRNYTTIKFPIFQGGKNLLAGYTIDITERVQAEDELHRSKEALEVANLALQTALAREKQLSHTDSLTGINNRRHLFELAEREFNIAIRYRHPLSVMMFDIDHFKGVNDTFGHAVGDQILQRVTQIACVGLRSADVIGRYGGEEFVIMLPMTDAQQVYPVAERIRAGVAALRVPTPKGDAAVTISIGISETILKPQDESVENVIRRADEAMYAAKQAGRNRTVIFGPDGIGAI